MISCHFAMIRICLGCNLFNTLFHILLERLLPYFLKGQLLSVRLKNRIESLKKNCTTPPSISFVWIVFGVLHRDPTQLGQIQTKSIPNRDQPTHQDFFSTKPFSVIKRNIFYFVVYIIGKSENEAIHTGLFISLSIYKGLAKFQMKNITTNKQVTMTLLAGNGGVVGYPMPSSISDPLDFLIFNTQFVLRHLMQGRGKNKTK